MPNHFIPECMANYNTLIEKHNAKLATVKLQSTQQGYQNSDHQMSSSHQRPPAPPQAAFAASAHNLVQHTYPIDTVNTSNQQLINANFSHEPISMSVFQSLCPSTVQLFSDGIYRIVNENNGIVTHIPALVNEG